MMLEYFVAWIDHHEARIFEVGPKGVHSQFFREVDRCVGPCPTDGQLFAYAKRYFHTDVQPG